jgi:hypothetical protein
MFKVYPAVAAMMLALSAPGAASTFSIGPLSGESALMSVRPETTSVPPFQLGAFLLTLPTPTANGKAVAHVPCLSCVLPPASGYTKPVVASLGLGEPLSIIPKSVKAGVLVVTYSDTSYTGSCKVHVTVAIGTTVVINQTSPAITGFKASTYGYVSGSFARPNIPFTGEVTLTEQAICGTYKSNIVSSELFIE